MDALDIMRHINYTDKYNRVANIINTILAYSNMHGIETIRKLNEQSASALRPSHQQEPRERARRISTELRADVKQNDVEARI
jgi:hypothetical protein